MEKISKTYRTDLIETAALREFSLQVRQGEFVALTGPSGSGKSTLLSIAGLLEDFDSGELEIAGQPVRDLGDRARSRLRNEKIGFIFQSFNLIPDLDVWDNVDLPLRYRAFSASERKQRIESALLKVGLLSRAHHLPSQLSGGQQQRVAIARALAGSPAFLLADEPTGNLDSAMAQQVMELLQQLHAEGCTIVMVTHDPDQARLASRRIHVLDGQVHEVHEEQRISLRQPQGDLAGALA